MSVLRNRNLVLCWPFNKLQHFHRLTFPKKTERKLMKSLKRRGHFLSSEQRCGLGEWAADVLHLRQMNSSRTMMGLMIWILIFCPNRPSNEQDMIRKGDGAPSPHHNDQVKNERCCRRGSIQRKIIGIRPLVRGFKIAWRRAGLGAELRMHLQSWGRRDRRQKLTRCHSGLYPRWGNWWWRKKEGRRDEALNRYRSVISVHRIGPHSDRQQPGEY